MSLKIVFSWSELIESPASFVVVFLELRVFLHIFSVESLNFSFYHLDWDIPRPDRQYQHDCDPKYIRRVKTMRYPRKGWLRLPLIYDLPLISLFFFHISYWIEFDPCVFRQNLKLQNLRFKMGILHFILSPLYLSVASPDKLLIISHVLCLARLWCIGCFSPNWFCDDIPAC